MFTHRIITTIAATLLSALAPVVLPTPVAAAPPAGVVRPAEFSLGTRPCFLVRTPWNVALDGQPPLCG
jgi:hypothetical protein